MRGQSTKSDRNCVKPTFSPSSPRQRFNDRVRGRHPSGPTHKLASWLLANCHQIWPDDAQVEVGKSCGAMTQQPSRLHIPGVGNRLRRHLVFAGSGLQLRRHDTPHDPHARTWLRRGQDRAMPTRLTGMRPDLFHMWVLHAWMWVLRAPVVTPNARHPNVREVAVPMLIDAE